jgi:hypothetical protein
MCELFERLKALDASASASKRKELTRRHWTFGQSGDPWPHGGRVGRAEKADSGQLSWVLRPCSERPSYSRATDEAYELAPPQMTELHPLPLAGLTA